MVDAGHWLFQVAGDQQQVAALVNDSTREAALIVLGPGRGWFAKTDRVDGHLHEWVPQKMFACLNILPNVVMLTKHLVTYQSSGLWLGVNHTARYGPWRFFESQQ